MASTQEPSLAETELVVVPTDDRQIAVSSLGAAVLGTVKNILLRRWGRYAQQAGATGVELTHPKLMGRGPWLRLAARRGKADSGEGLTAEVHALHQGWGIGLSPRRYPSVGGERQWDLRRRRVWHDTLPVTVVGGMLVGAPDDFEKFVRRWMHANGRTKEDPGSPIDLVGYGQLEIFGRPGKTDFTDLKAEYKPPIRYVLAQIHPGQNWELSDLADPVQTAQELFEQATESGLDGFCLDTFHLAEWVEDTFRDSKSLEEKVEYANALGYELGRLGAVKRIHFGPGRAMRQFDKMPYEPTETSAQEAQEELYMVVNGKISETRQGAILQAVRKGHAERWVKLPPEERVAEPFLIPVTLENPPTAALTPKQLARPDIPWEEHKAPSTAWRRKTTLLSSKAAITTTKAVIEAIKRSDLTFKAEFSETFNKHVGPRPPGSPPKDGPRLAP